MKAISLFLSLAIPMGATALVTHWMDREWMNEQKQSSEHWHDVETELRDALEIQQAVLEKVFPGTLTQIKQQREAEKKQWEADIDAAISKP